MDMDNGVSEHMKSSWEFFETLTKWDFMFHVEVSYKSQNVFRGLGVVPFRMDLYGFLQVQDVL